ASNEDRARIQGREPEKAAVRTPASVKDRVVARIGRHIEDGDGDIFGEDHPSGKPGLFPREPHDDVAQLTYEPLEARLFAGQHASLLWVVALRRTGGLHVALAVVLARRHVVLDLLSRTRFVFVLAFRLVVTRRFGLRSSTTPRQPATHHQSAAGSRED